MNAVVRSPVAKEFETQVRHFYEGMSFGYLIGRREALKESTDSKDQVRVRVLNEMIGEYEVKIREHYEAMDDLRLEVAHGVLNNSRDPGDLAKAKIVRAVMSNRE